MNSQRHNLHVTSHVGRDLLQSAELFHHVQNVIWEYVSNGLEYVNVSVQPMVKVAVTSAPRKKVSIEDNGRGMSSSDLRRFFQMHAENQDRAAGRPGRGYFGTGKSAAFGIANLLQITTVRENRKCVVELHRSDVDAASSGTAVPVREIEMDQLVRAPNGTLVEIEEIRNVQIDRDEVRRTLERHIRHWRRAIVELNGQRIEYNSPPISRTEYFAAPDDKSEFLRGAQLMLHVAQAPLSEGDRGVAILSNDVLHETTLAGSKSKEMVNYIFGEIDVPALSQPYEGIPAFDMSRSGRLNIENKVVLATHSFVGRSIEILRKQLVEEERQRRAHIEAERLQAQANEIAQIINEDYVEYQRRFSTGNNTRVGGADNMLASRPNQHGERAFVLDGTEPAKEVAKEGSGGRGPGRGGLGEGGRRPSVVPSAEGEASGRYEASERARRRSAGGFDVRYRSNGVDAPRASYERNSRTIYINLDHPQLQAAARGGRSTPIDDGNFRRLSFEVAFTEYAIGFAQENAAAGYYLDFQDPLIDMRERIDSLSRRAAHLFAPAH